MSVGRLSAIVAGTVGLMIAGGGVGSAVPVTGTPQPAGSGFDLWTGGQPDFSILGVEFTNWAKVMVWTFWGVCLAVASVRALWSFVKVGMAKRHGRPDEASDRMTDMYWALGAVALILSAPALMDMAGNVRIGGAS